MKYNTKYYFMEDVLFDTGRSIKIRKWEIVPVALSAAGVFIMAIRQNYQLLPVVVTDCRDFCGVYEEKYEDAGEEEDAFLRMKSQGG